MYLTLVGLGALAAFVCTSLSVPVVSRIARDRGWLDAPDGARKLHATATPNVGGLAIAAGCAAGLTFLAWVQHFLPFQLSFPSLAVGVGAVVMVCTGLYDDVRGLGFKGKFLVQIIVAYVLIHAGYRIDVAVFFPQELSDVYQQALYSIPLTMLWIVGIINAVNLLDGVDGLAAGVSMIAFIALAAVVGVSGEVGLAVLAIPVAAALASFLVHNFNPASIFMGDSGSLLLGYLLAVYSLQASSLTSSAASYLAPVVVLGLPILDTGLSIVRRAARRQPIFAPDADHIHHRLVKRYSVRRAVVTLYGAALLFGTVAVFIASATPVEAGVLLAISAAVTVVWLRQLGYAPLKEWSERAEPSDAAELLRVDADAVEVVHSSVVPIPTPTRTIRPNARKDEAPALATDGGGGDADRHVLVVRMS